MPEGNGEARDFFRAKLPLIGPVPYKNNGFSRAGSTKWMSNFLIDRAPGSK